MRIIFFRDNYTHLPWVLLKIHSPPLTFQNLHSPPLSFAQNTLTSPHILKPTLTSLGFYSKYTHLPSHFKTYTHLPWVLLFITKYPKCPCLALLPLPRPVKSPKNIKNLIKIYQNLVKARPKPEPARLSQSGSESSLGFGFLFKKPGLAWPAL